MSAGDTTVGGLHGGIQSIDDGPNVLALSPSMDPDADVAYFESLLPDATGRDVLAVAYDTTPDRTLEAWRSHAGGTPTRCTIVDVGNGGPVDDPVDAGPKNAAGPVAIEAVDRPDDLTGLAIRIGEYLRERGNEETIVTFDTLTVLLQYVSLERAFRFLHVLVDRIRQAGASAYYRLDPAAHDERTIATIRSLFDSVVAFEDDEWRPQ